MKRTVHFAILDKALSQRATHVRANGINRQYPFPIAKQTHLAVTDRSLDPSIIPQFPKLGNFHKSVTHLHPVPLGLCFDFFAMAYPGNYRAT